MIDEEKTFEKYGYYSTDLKPTSHKRIVVMCNDCGAIRYIEKRGYSDVCRSCSRKYVILSVESRIKIRDGNRGKIVSDETRVKMSKSHTGKVRTDEHRQHLSAGAQGIPYDEWTGFAKENQYCEKFDEACRERIRAKYDRKCYICDKKEEDNGQKLSVHHTDMNKNQGCDGVLWKLVPLCRGCHSKALGDPMKSMIEYLLNDEETTENLQ